MARTPKTAIACVMLAALLVLSGCAADRAAALRAAVIGTWKVDAEDTAPAVASELGKAAGPMSEILASFLVSLAPPQYADNLKSSLSFVFDAAGEWLGDAEVMAAVLSFVDDRVTFEFVADGTFKATSTLTGGGAIAGTWVEDVDEDAVFLVLDDPGQFPERSRITVEDDNRLRLISPPEPGPLPMVVLILERA